MTGWLDEATWASVRGRLPVPCVDLVPVRVDTADHPVEVGLIERDSPFGRRWCQIGGRVRRGETIRAALLRHFEHTVSGAGVDLPDDPQPDYVMQWFPEEIPIERDGVAYGHDPRQHALALCFLVRLSGEPMAVEGGEALRFGWFGAADLPSLGDRLWPGTGEMVAALGSRGGW